MAGTQNTPARWVLSALTLALLGACVDVASDAAPPDAGTTIPDTAATDVENEAGDALVDTSRDTPVDIPEDLPAPEDTSSDVPDAAPDLQDGADTPDAEDTSPDTGPNQPTLADLWAGRAAFVIGEQTGPIGHPGMHFLSTWWHEDTLWAYYIRNVVVNDVGRSATGLATSTDGVTFEDQGTVLDIGGSWDREWRATHPAMGHNTGVADADGWAANTADHDEGHLLYGPYVADLAAGPQTASFELLIDVVNASDDVVATIDVFDATAGRTLATRDLRRSEFVADRTYRIFNLDWSQTAGNRMEFRVYFHRRSYVRVRTVAVAQGHAPFPDDRLASFPGVWRDADTWYLVYEAAGTDRRWPGDVALATSTDGRSFTRHDPNPLLGHLDGGWEDVNIGTPSLLRHEGTWYLFYHGFDGDDVQIGVATGPSLDRLTRHAQNPIVRTSGGGWDSGTAGARSIIREGDTWYMAYEGSSDPPYDRANWSTGLARSTNLITWEKYARNPVLPVTNSSFGYDGPELVRTSDGGLHIYYRDPGPGNRTWRATLTWR